jgi:hypothetical protein
VFLFRLGRLGRMGPLGIAFTGYQLWRRLSPQQRAALKQRGSGFVAQAKKRRAGGPRLTDTPSVISRVGAATAPAGENPLNRPDAEEHPAP